MASTVVLVVGAVIVAPPAGAKGPEARSADRDCSDFSNQAAAQRYFIERGGPDSDPDRLDADGDGIACEALACPCSRSRGDDRPDRPRARRPRRPPALFRGLCRRGREPDRHRRCTPGRVDASLTAADVCNRDRPPRGRRIPSSTQRRVYLRYGIRRHRPFAYEIDRLVPLELGGTNSLRNLWPQKTQFTFDKERAERALHQDVCTGVISLRQAQRRVRRWHSVLRAGIDFQGTPDEARAELLNAALTPTPLYSASLPPNLQRARAELSIVRNTFGVTFLRRSPDGTIDSAFIVRAPYQELSDELRFGRTRGERARTEQIGTRTVLYEEIGQVYGYMWREQDFTYFVAAHFLSLETGWITKEQLAEIVANLAPLEQPEATAPPAARRR